MLVFEIVSDHRSINEWAEIMKLIGIEKCSGCRAELKFIGQQQITDYPNGFSLAIFDDPLVFNQPL